MPSVGFSTGNGAFSVSLETWSWEVSGEGAGAGVVCGVEHAVLPQEQHWQMVPSSTVCGATEAIACITRSRIPKTMFNAARIWSTLITNRSDATRG